jgi:formylglycine-generating enzyme required for sulfatase activity
VGICRSWTSIVDHPWGDAFDDAKANIVDDRTQGSWQPSCWQELGNAFDMAGNAMEWVKIGSVPFITNRAFERIPGPTTGSIKIEKGGWWGSNPYVARSAYRHFEDPPDYTDQHIGFE